MGLSKRMRYQRSCKYIIANANCQQSVRIISSPCAFNTAIIVTQSSIFTVHTIKEHKNHTKLLAAARSHTLTMGCYFYDP